MENKRFRQAQHHGALLAITRQLLQRGLITQSEYAELEQTLDTEYHGGISHTQKGEDTSAPKKQIIRKGGQKK